MIDPRMLKLIKAVSLNEKNTVSQQIIKLMEEIGEMSQAFLICDGAPSCQYRDSSIEDVREEALDAILVLFSILYALDTEEDEVQAILRKKLIKWYGQQTKDVRIDLMFDKLD